MFCRRVERAEDGSMNSMVKKIVGSNLGDYAKAMFVLMGLPMLFVFIILSFLNRFCRVFLTPCGKIASEEEKQGWFTIICQRYLLNIRNWRWSSVLSKTAWLATVYIIFFPISSKAVMVFLAALNTALEPRSRPCDNHLHLHWGVHVPPSSVPGVPVYMFGRVVLVKKAGDSMALRSQSYTPYLSAYVSNCSPSRCSKSALANGLVNGFDKKDGVHQQHNHKGYRGRAFKTLEEFRKGAILIGGPDWPTSVLTGILKLPLLSMLTGTLPVAFLVAPTVMAGAFMLRANEGGAWSSLAGIFMAIAAMSQMASGFAAMYFVDKAVRANPEAIAAVETDKEVAELERKEEHAQNVYQEVTDWHLSESLTTAPRSCLVAGSCFLIVSFNIFMWRSSDAMHAFAVTDSIEEKLGDPVHRSPTRHYRFRSRLSRYRIHPMLQPCRGRPIKTDLAPASSP